MKGRWTSWRWWVQWRTKAALGCSCVCTVCAQAVCGGDRVVLRVSAVGELLLALPVPAPTAASVGVGVGVPTHAQRPPSHTVLCGGPADFGHAACLRVDGKSVRGGGGSCAGPGAYSPALSPPHAASIPTPPPPNRLPPHPQVSGQGVAYGTYHWQVCCTGSTAVGTFSS
jgi:hypothetical protein